jgi:hypothetical protein
VDDDILPAISVFIGLAAFAVLLRILARILTSAYFWWDDACNFLAMVLHPDRACVENRLTRKHGQFGCIATTVLNFRCKHSHTLHETAAGADFDHSGPYGPGKGRLVRRA